MLYHNLTAQIVVYSANELLEELFSLEGHEVMRMSQSANLLEDIIINK
jgi:hypothetical protein